MSGISDLTAAQLSNDAYTPLSQQTNIGAWVPYAGQSGLPNLSGIDTTGNNQFVTYVNSSTKQIVVAFKGTDTIPNFRSDLTNSGGSQWESIKPVAQAQLANIEQSFPGYQIMTDGHSLGGGMAQTFGLENGLSGYGQNSLPISQTAISTDMGNNLAGYLANWTAAGATFNETNMGFSSSPCKE